MNEFFSLLKKWDLKGIFLSPTENGFLELFRYLFVGGIATVVDWGVSFGSEWGLGGVLPIHPQWIYLMATTLGFFAGLLVNFLLSRAFVFSAKTARAKTRVGEFLGHFSVGAIGLLMSYLIVWLGTSFIFPESYAPARISATVIVFVWNYLARKFLVYQK